MPSRPTIKPYVNTRLVTVGPDMPVVEAVALLLRDGISGAPVIDDTGGLMGVITAKDCFRAALHASYYQGSEEVVGDYMTRNVETMDAGIDLVTAAERFIASEFRRFPVMEEGRLIGMIMRLDLLRALNDHWKSL